MRLAGGEKLEDTQMKKIGTKAAVQPSSIRLKLRPKRVIQNRPYLTVRLR